MECLKNKMTLPNNGNSKKIKYVKCDHCKGRIVLESDNIIKIDSYSYIECDYCGTQILLKK